MSYHFRSGQLTAFLYFLFLSVGLCLGQEQANPQPAHVWQVGVAGTPPFVVGLDGELEGVSVETWRVLAKELNIDFKLKGYESQDQALTDLSEGKLDAVIGPLSITSARSEKVDFSQPYYVSYQGLLSREHRESPLQRGLSIGEHLLIGATVMVFVLLMVGGGFWLLEHKVNPSHFAPEPRHGIGSGVWMALVTATTVGYGDKAPVSFWGRVLAGMWMLTTTLTVSSFTAWVATNLTVWSLQSPFVERPSQLEDKRVAVVADTSSESFGRHFTSRLVKCHDFMEGLKLLEEGKVDVVVYDYSVISFHLGHHPDLGVRVATSAYAVNNFGFALPKNSQELSRVNVALLRLKENGTLRDIRHEWFHEPEDLVEHSF